MRTIWSRTAIRALAGTGALAAVAAAAAATTAGGASAPAPMEFTLYMKGGAQKIVDSPPRGGRGPGMGDFVAFHKNLVDADGRRVGRVQASGIITEAGRNPTETLQGIMILDGGRLAVAESFRFSDKVHHLAILGGTGRFEGATGSIRARARRSGDELAFRVWLP